MKLHELQATEGSRFEHYRKQKVAVSNTTVKAVALAAETEKLLVKVTKVKTPVVVAVLP